MTHRIISVDILPDKIYHEASINYIVKGDDQEIVLRAMTVFGKVMGEDKISYSHSYMYLSTLLERTQVVEERQK